MASQGMTSTSSGEDVPDSCHICKSTFNHPRVLSCLHVFCEGCLEKKFQENGILHNVIECSLCGQETEISSEGISGLPLDCIGCNRIHLKLKDLTQIICTSCKAEETAVAHCTECASFLCPNCYNAHNIMHCFKNHTVHSLDEMKRNGDSIPVTRNPLTCASHPNKVLKFYCHTCHIPICSKCMVLDHKPPEHCCERAVEAESKVRDDLKTLIAESKSKVAFYKEAAGNVDAHLSELQVQRDNTQSHIKNTFERYKAILEKQQKGLLKEIEGVHSSQESRLANSFHNAQNLIRKRDDACKFAERLLNFGNTLEVLSLIHVVQSQLLIQINNMPKLDIAVGMAFETDKSKFKSAIKEIFGHVKETKPLAEKDDSSMTQKASTMHSSSHFESDAFNFAFKSISSDKPLPSLDLDLENNFVAQHNLLQLANLTQRSLSPSSSSSTPNSVCSNELLIPSTQIGVTDAQMNCLGAPDNVGSMSLGKKLSPVASQFYYPATRSSYVEPITMSIRYIFGDLGSGENQFNTPRGFCLGLKEEIIVADTNNHRIQIYEKNGDFKCQFGFPGKGKGQLWYPRKVTVIQSSGKIVVCDRGSERSRMQIFTKTGHFLKTIDIQDTCIVSGLTTTREDTIIFVDSGTRTVFIISETGDLLHSFDCCEYMKEPSEIAFYQKEFYICDFKGHCVAVFSDTGKYLRQIGSEYVTKYPNGIDISSDGDVLVCDSHRNQFHIAVFSKEGSLLCEFQCPDITISHCCGLKITYEGYMITLSKKNHHVVVLDKLYIM